ncbi:Hypothetical predicted protein [Octopus vulgaris]|uniref:Uncharacterized protein n=1 Tax=Octopus vulgaris TaxID=6645 RepID=A0AA36B157_OCTVU|nr:Hypothetical predicted protein [Octopus vulgaris]
MPKISLFFGGGMLRIFLMFMLFIFGVAIHRVAVIIDVDGVVDDEGGVGSDVIIITAYIQSMKEGPLVL